MELYRATARQRGNSFPSCAWRISQLHRDFSFAFARRFLDLTTFYDKFLEKYIYLIFLLLLISFIIRFQAYLLISSIQPSPLGK